MKTLSEQQYAALAKCPSWRLLKDEMDRPQTDIAAYHRRIDELTAAVEREREANGDEGFGRDKVEWICRGVLR